MSEKLHERIPEPADAVEKAIGEIIAGNLIDDGATLQLGIGAIPDACLLALKGHKNLGIHSEMFSDGVMDLYDSGVITNSKKTHKPGYLVGCVCARARAGAHARARAVVSVPSRSPPQRSSSGRASCTTGATIILPLTCAT